MTDTPTSRKTLDRISEHGTLIDMTSSTSIALAPCFGTLGLPVLGWNEQPKHQDRRGYAGRLESQAL